MPGQTDDRERSPFEDNYSADDVYTSGMLRKDIERLRRDVQLISPKSNEQAYGSNTVLPANNMVQLMPYDRSRVRAIISCDNGPVATFTNYTASSNTRLLQANPDRIALNIFSQATGQVGFGFGTQIVLFNGGGNASLTYPTPYTGPVDLVYSQVATASGILVETSLPRLRIGSKSDLAGGGGYMLNPGQQFTYESIAELWVIASGQVTISRLVERQGGDVK